MWYVAKAEGHIPEIVTYGWVKGRGLDRRPSRAIGYTRGRIQVEGLIWSQFERMWADGLVRPHTRRTRFRPIGALRETRWYVSFSRSVVRY